MKTLFSVLLLFIAPSIFASDDITGFWKTVDEETGKIKGIVAIYPYQGKYYGRIIGGYDDKMQIYDSIYAPVRRAQALEGDPYYSGLDIIWDLKKDGSKFLDGEVLDPQTGRIYGAELWIEKGNLIVRGILLLIGKNQTWISFPESEFTESFKKPDLKTFIPSIPKPKPEAPPLDSGKG